MNALCSYLAGHGDALLAAATCLLAVGCVGVALQRSPIHRQRAAEMAILAVLLWLVLASVPLPRYRLAEIRPSGSVASAGAQPPERITSPPPVFQPADEPIWADVTTPERPPTPPGLLPPEIGAAAENDCVIDVALPKLSEPPTVVHTGPPPAAKPRRPIPSEARHTPLPQPAPLGSAAPVWDMQRWLATAYVAGGLACLLWLALGRVLLRRMLRSARPPQPWLRDLYAGLPFAGRVRPRLVISDRCTRALSFGIWRPTIVLPADACGAEHGQALRYVLLHELAHARQRDGWGHWLFNVAFPVLYFHPLYWWIRCRAYLAAELIADDVAAAPAAKESYVEALIALARRGGRRQLAYVGSAEIFGSRSQFYRRMQMLLSRETRLARRCSPLWRLVYPAACLLAVALVAGVAGLRPAEAQSDDAVDLASEPAAEPAPAAEASPELPAGSEPVLDVAAEPADVAEPEAPPRARRSDASRAERDLLRAQLQALQSSVDALRQMVEELRARQAAADAREHNRTSPPLAAPSPGATATPPTYPEAPTVPTPPTAHQPMPNAPSAPAAPSRVESPAPRPTLPGPEAPAAWSPKSASRGSAFTLQKTASVVIPELASRGSATDPLAPAAERGAAEDSRLDLVRLATSLAEAVGEVEIAQVECASRKELAERKAASQHEVAIAEIRLNTASRKLHLLRTIAESALMAAEAEMDAARSQLEGTRRSNKPAVAAAKARVLRAESRINILKSILDSAKR